MNSSLLLLTLLQCLAGPPACLNRYAVNFHEFHSPNGGFLKWGYLQIIHLSGIFPYKPSICIPSWVSSKMTARAEEKFCFRKFDITSNIKDPFELGGPTMPWSFLESFLGTPSPHPFRAMGIFHEINQPFLGVPPPPF